MGYNLLRTRYLSYQRANETGRSGNNVVRETTDVSRVYVEMERKRRTIKITEGKKGGGVKERRK